MYNKWIFWFRQDMRVQDNTGLFEAIHNCAEVLPIFILDEHITPWFGGLTDNKFWFIREALEQVSAELKSIWGDKVIVLKWKPEEIIPDLVKKYEIQCLYTNTSYGTYGKARDRKVFEKVSELGCAIESHKDFLIAEPHEVEQRKVFTPYFKLWKKHQFDTSELTIDEFEQLETTEQTEAKDFIDIEQHPYFRMSFWKKRFEGLPFERYDETRNNLDQDWTSRLSPYLRFGVYSVRQIYNKVVANYDSYELNQKKAIDTYVSELVWREFWWQIFYNFPNTKHEEFQEKRRHIEWSQDIEMFEKWCKWETGYPVVDAAMKQLNETNWMHGRARMIVASFLTKDMHIDWRLGEKYFKEKLLDYDEAVNLWNWQWSASVGADPKPLRIFNPILQSQKFDKAWKYIEKYIPELSGQPIKAVHNPLEQVLNYIPTIVDHRIETRRARELYKNPDYVPKK